MVTTPFGTAQAVAHRGASDVAPENTLAAVRRAVHLGADVVEVDVRRTRDGALVLVHDATLARTTDATPGFPRLAPWRVEDLTLAEVQRLDAGAWKAPRFAGERVPTLEESLAALAGTGVSLLLEVKEPASQPGLVEDVAEAVACAGATDRVVVQSFDHAAMRALRSLEPDVRVGVLGRAPRDELRWYAEWARFVNPSQQRLDREYVDEVHRWGMASLVWTVDRPWAMRRALRAGVDGVITNRLETLQGVLGRPQHHPGTAPAHASQTKGDHGSTVTSGGWPGSSRLHAHGVVSPHVADRRARHDRSAARRPRRRPTRRPTRPPRTRAPAAAPPVDAYATAPGPPAARRPRRHPARHPGPRRRDRLDQAPVGLAARAGLPRRHRRGGLLLPRRRHARSLSPSTPSDSVRPRRSSPACSSCGPGRCS